MKKSFVLSAAVMALLCFCMMVCSTAFATDIWKASGVDFKKIKTVKIEEVSIGNSRIDCFALRKGLEVMARQHAKDCLKKAQLTDEDTADCRVYIRVNNFDTNYYWEPSSATGEEKSSTEYRDVEKFDYDDGWGSFDRTERHTIRRTWTVPKVKQGHLWFNYVVNVDITVKDSTGREIYRYHRDNEPETDYKGYNKIMWKFFEKFNSTI